jgi:hypothetical protein
VDDTKFSYCTGGYKFGKTYIYVRKGLKCLTESGQDGLLAEPNYRMNEDILRPALEEGFKEQGIKYRWDSSNSIYHTLYGKILLRTQDKRSSLEGHNIGWFGLDEMDLLPKEKSTENWNTLISKLTKGTKQFGFGVGTNEGFEFIYKKFYKGAEKIDNVYVKPNHKLFVGSTLENKANLPEGYIETLFENYDSSLIARYIHGEFVNIKSGRVYTKFTDKNKVKIGFNPNKPVFMCWDVNYSDRPMSTTIIQPFHWSEVWDVKPDFVNDKEIYIATAGFYNKNTNTDVQCQIIKRFLDSYNYNGKILIYGDRVGHDRRVGAARSHYETVCQYFNLDSNRDVKTRATRSIIDRVACVQRMLENAKGEKAFFINIELEPLIIDYEQTVWKSNQNELDSSNLRTDPTDSVSYYFQKEHNVIEGFTTGNYKG